MENNEIIYKLERRNYYIRIITLVVLVALALLVLYFKFGYTDPDDIGIMDRIGRNISCRDALNYYAEHEWGYYTRTNDFMNMSVPLP